MSWMINLNNFPPHSQWSLIKEDVSPAQSHYPALVLIMCWCGAVERLL